jgi:hypothetical protein
MSTALGSDGEMKRVTAEATNGRTDMIEPDRPKYWMWEWAIFVVGRILERKSPTTR